MRTMRRLLGTAATLAAMAAPAAYADAVWQPVPSPHGLTAQLDVGFDPFGGEHVTALTSPRLGGDLWLQVDGDVLRSGDAGRTWQDTHAATVGALAIDPFDAQHAWGTSQGDLVETRDGGTTWHPTSFSRTVLAGPDAVPGRPTYAPALVLVDPRRPGVLYALLEIQRGRFIAGDAVYASHDGGATWLRWPQLVGLVDPGSDGTSTFAAFPGQDALLAVRVGGPLPGHQSLESISADGRRILRQRPGTDDLTTRFVVAPSDPPRILLETRSRGWLVSPDGGGRWNRLGLALGPREPMPVFDPQHPDTISALKGGTALWQTRDGGRHWRRVSSPRIPGATRLVAAPGLLVASGPSGVALSRDGGRTFRPSGAEGLGVLHYLRLSFAADGSWLAASRAGAFELAPDGASWQRLDRDVLPVPTTAVAPLGRTGGVVAVRGGPFVRPPGETRWTALPTGNLRWDLVSALTADATGRRVLTDRGDWTADGGRRWHHDTTRTDDWNIALPVSLPGTAWATDGSTRLWRSTDGGAHWSVRSTLPATGCAAHPAGALQLYVLCPQPVGLLRSDDGGATVAPVAQPGWAIQVAADPRRPDIVVAAVSVVNTSVLEQSLDAGRTWTVVDPAFTGSPFLLFAPDGRLLDPASAAGGIQALTPDPPT